MSQNRQQLQLRFASKKKYNRFFYLKNYVTVDYDKELRIQSNEVVVISPINKYSSDNCNCDVPYWRN